jgi:hypothetical protein
MQENFMADNFATTLAHRANDSDRNFTEIVDGITDFGIFFELTPDSRPRYRGIGTAPIHPNRPPTQIRKL